MPAAVWPAEDTPAESKAAPYANKAPQTGPTGSQAPHSPALGSFAADDPPRSAPPAGCTKKALPILAARRAWQIIPSFPRMTESPSGLAVERVFQQPARAWRSHLNVTHMPLVAGPASVRFGGELEVRQAKLDDLAENGPSADIPASGALGGGL